MTASAPTCRSQPIHSSSSAGPIAVLDEHVGPQIAVVPIHRRGTRPPTGFSVLAARTCSAARSSRVRWLPPSQAGNTCRNPFGRRCPRVHFPTHSRRRPGPGPLPICGHSSSKARPSGAVEIRRTSRPSSSVTRRVNSPSSSCTTVPSGKVTSIGGWASAPGGARKEPRAAVEQGAKSAWDASRWTNRPVSTSRNPYARSPTTPPDAKQDFVDLLALHRFHGEMPEPTYRCACHSLDTGPGFAGGQLRCTGGPHCPWFCPGPGDVERRTLGRALQRPP